MKYYYNPQAEYALWRAYWYSKLYGASTETTMNILDSHRARMGSNWRLPA